MSLEQGMLVVIVVSALFVPLWFAFRSRAFTYGSATAFPLVASVALYWGPNLAQFHNAEYRTWEGLFIASWFVPALLVSLLLTFLIDVWRRKRRSRKNVPEAGRS